MEMITMHSNEYLKVDTYAFYSLDYIKMGAPGNPDFINVLKNDFGQQSDDALQGAINELCELLASAMTELGFILDRGKLALCVVPRAKAEGHYTERQQLFRTVVQHVANSLPGFVDGTNYIVRHTNTRTNHCKKYDTDGDLPYVGITRDTCTLSSGIRGKHIVLVDDVYTPTCNVDEDAVQALLDAGAASVTFYAVAKTVKRYGSDGFQARTA